MKVIALTAMLAVSTALAACAANDHKTAMRDDPTSSPAAYDSMAASTRKDTAASTPATTTAQNWGGVVTAVDPILRQDAAAMGVGVAGAAAAGGTLAYEGSPTDKVYRVTIRADDGTTQVVVVDNMPSYKAGDRVRYRNGSVQRE